MISPFFSIGFEYYFFVRARVSIKDLFAEMSPCGIYILHFLNGEYYVGQAINVVARYLNHRKKHLDIDYISFREVSPADHDAGILAKMRGGALRYDHPTDPVGVEDWEAMR